MTELDYSLMPFLAGGNMPTNDGSGAESRLASQLDIMNSKLDRLIQDNGRMSNEIEHLVGAAKTSQEYGTRLTVVETKADMNEKWVERSGVNNRWLIGLCLVTLLGVIGLALKVFGHA